MAKVLSKEEYVIKSREYEKLPHGARVAGENGVIWVKDFDDLWNSHRGIRVNSSALVGYVLDSKPEEKLKKGLSEDSFSLFD